MDEFSEYAQAAREIVNGVLFDAAGNYRFGALPTLNGRIEDAVAAACAVGAATTIPVWGFVTRWTGAGFAEIRVGADVPVTAGWLAAVERAENARLGRVDAYRASHDAYGHYVPDGTERDGDAIDWAAIPIVGII